MDWKYFLKEFLGDKNVKIALGVVLGAILALIPGLSNDVRLAIASLILSALFIWAGVQNAKDEHDYEIEYRAEKAKRLSKSEEPDKCSCKCD